MIVYLHPHSRKYSLFLKDDLVAQLVEHLPFKEVVLGSSPSQVTKKSSIKSRLFSLYQFLFTEVLELVDRHG